MTDNKDDFDTEYAERMRNDFLDALNEKFGEEYCRFAAYPLDWWLALGDELKQTPDQDLAFAFLFCNEVNYRGDHGLAAQEDVMREARKMAAYRQSLTNLPDAM